MSSKSTFFGKNEIIFTMLRYLTYGLMTIRGFVLAYYLGPYLLGIYGYLMLYQQYMSYTSFGINYSLNAELALLTVGQKQERKSLIDSAFSGVLLISGLLIFIGIIAYGFKLKLFPFENSYKYAIIIVALTILTHFQQVFVNIFRVNKKLKPVIVGELVLAVGLLVVIFFFEGIELINVLFYVWGLSLLLIVLFYKIVYSEKITVNFSKVRLLLKSGLPLLVYAFSYYLMGLMIRTLIGAFYPIEVMGYFSFANNITTAIMLGLDTVTWIIFPSIIARLADNNLSKDELQKYLVSFTNRLLVLVLIIVLLSIGSLPILFYILPKYRPIEFSLIILLMNQIVFNLGFVFVTLCIARKMHNQMALISLLSVVVSGVLSLVFCLNKLPYIWLVISNVIGSLFFVNLLIYFISNKFSLLQDELRRSFNWTTQLLFVLIVISALLQSYVCVVIFLVLLLLTKIHSIRELYWQFRNIYVK
ncbi:hypothetical protein FBD94_22395 [Pedobacter hiemivivus]|uniref:Polysaccharide biosynthesis protein C-terminal domain-containing protein n=1 Tax=Pedobacter hiemivivus TaxID=2530454 RepID=A0A4U1G327_9SPHI|nr:oligosaccharide flippase family protein [Pedobacter hiemivivus]TKC56950.1 hypothetical protein FBD94_22395 [Pedobacter hiemivivus]